MMDYNFEVRKLSSQFYKDYPHSHFPDILNKPGRPYNVLLVDTHTDYYICIPYRSEIPHDYAFKFQTSHRSTISVSGLDYTKICIIKNHDYIDNLAAIVDQDEYVETRNNIDKIVEESCNYINEYIDHIAETHKLSNRKFNKKYKYTALKYFHVELGI